jgi:tRNA dimethylallyltransferase
MDQPRLLVALVGATASGKTELALDLAESLDLEILGADSRQVYRRLDIGTAKPTPEQRGRAPHHLIDHVEPIEDYQAYRYQTELRRLLPQISARGRVPLIVGGTGLYLRAGIEGLSEASPADPDLRSRLRAELAAIGPEPLHARLAALDPAAASRVHPRDRVRIVRFLEICLTIGRPASEHLAAHRAEPLPCRVVYLGLHWPRAALYARIERRTADLLRRGWIEEVEALLASGVPPRVRSMQSLGYREIVEHLGSRLGRSELEARIALQTRRYAKRQLTWFRSLPVHWLDAAYGGPPLVERALAVLRPEIENAT